MKCMTIPLQLLMILVFVLCAFNTHPVYAAEIDKVKLIKEFGEREYIDDVIKYDNKVFFLIENRDEDQAELWATDGTPEETKLIKAFGAHTHGFITYRSNSNQLPYEKWYDPILLNNTFFFIIREQTESYLWRSDGTVTGTSRVGKLGATSNVHIMDNVLYFFGYNSLWRSDGTKDGTWEVSNAFSKSYSNNPILYKNHFYFVAYDDIHHYELWVSDGTRGGTRIFKDINIWENSSWLCSSAHPCTGPSFPSDFTVHNNELFFVAYVNSYAPHTFNAMLYKTNGSELHLVTDFIHESNTLPRGAAIGGVLNDKLLLIVNSDTSGYELWTSDGTASGTFPIQNDLIVNANWDMDALSWSWLMQLDKEGYFIGNDGIHGKELWKTDGTEIGTVLVKDITPGPGNTDFDSLCSFPLPVLGEEFYFLANDQFWKSDGTTAGTMLMREHFYCDYEYYTDDFSGLFNNKVYLSASDQSIPDYNFELWVIDGSKAGTRLVTELLPAQDPKDALWSSSSSPRFFRALEDTLFFFANSNVYLNYAGYTRYRRGLYALTPTELTLPWLQPLLLNNKEQ